MTSIDWVIFLFAATIFGGLYLSMPRREESQPSEEQALKDRGDMISFFVHLIGIPIGIAIIVGFCWGMCKVIDGGMVVTKAVFTEAVDQYEKLPVKVEVKIERKKS